MDLLEPVQYPLIYPDGHHLVSFSPNSTFRGSFEDWERFRDKLDDVGAERVYIDSDGWEDRYSRFYLLDFSDGQAAMWQVDKVSRSDATDYWRIYRHKDGRPYFKAVGVVGTLTIDKLHKALDVIREKMGL